MTNAGSFYCGVAATIIGGSIVYLTATLHAHVADLSDAVAYSISVASLTIAMSGCVGLGIAPSSPPVPERAAPELGDQR